MATPAPTLGNRWTDHFLPAIHAAHHLLGFPAVAACKTAPTVQTMVDILNALATSKYKPDTHVLAKPGPAVTLAAQPPKLEAHTDYQVLTLNAITALNMQVSSATGGILFEDPFWATL